jgi:hypothetical protein
MQSILAAGACFLLSVTTLSAQTNAPFDGRPWHVGTGNQSVSFIQASPIGAFPRTNFIEAPPSVASLALSKTLGLVDNEDYLAWGSIEREPDKWDWTQHDAMEKNMRQAGLRYVVYDWLHFPPVWLRDQQKDRRTLMRCLEHGEEANYLSIFDPRTIEFYDRFYKHLREHFGDRVDDVYACILGPYGEGNYPLMVPDWVKMGHCHEGYWCGDAYAIRAFQAAMKKRYRKVKALNHAWGSRHLSFEDIHPPAEIARDKFKASPSVFTTPEDRRRWLDFITWYHQAIIDFTENSVKALLKYYPHEKVRTKPGGSAGGVNPIPWGTYCPGYARMARPYHIVLQPADCQGAVFADKWMGTAYQFYGVTECTEPAGGLDEKAFVRRMFSDASAGASQFFTYEFEQHAATMRKYLPLLTGKPGDTEVAVYCPTTLYRLGADLSPTISAGQTLRDLCEFDVLDEALIADSALSPKRYKYLLAFQGEIVDQPILDKFELFLRHGGKIILLGDFSIKNVEGQPWMEKRVLRGPGPAQSRQWRKDLGEQLKGAIGVDGVIDGVWTCRRGPQSFYYNSTDKAVDVRATSGMIHIEPNSISWRK